MVRYRTLEELEIARINRQNNQDSSSTLKGLVANFLTPAVCAGSIFAAAWSSRNSAYQGLYMVGAGIAGMAAGFFAITPVLKYLSRNEKEGRD